jgi:DMSO/TMAO reductase YedYZ molybdopterin-dependent catalytic subunit
MGFRDSVWLDDPRVRTGLTVFAAGVSTVGTSFALYGTTREFVVIGASRLALDLLPDRLLADIIWSLGDYSLALALVCFGVLLAGVAGVVSYLGYAAGAGSVDEEQVGVGVVTAVLVVWGLVTLTVGSVPAGPVPAVAGAAVPARLAGPVGVADATGPTPGPERSRRSLLGLLAGVGGYNVVTHAVGTLRGRAPTSGFDALDELDAVQARLADAEERSLDVAGMAGLVPDVEDFYTVDINPRPPTVRAGEWSLSVTGAVETEREFDYAALRERERVHRFKTLRCLGDQVDGDQIGTALWTGCSLPALLEEAGPQGSHVVLRAVDDYYYSMPLSMLEDALLAYGMNDEALPRQHGYPVRALVPDRWGKLNVKWLDEIEVVDSFESGYWEERGWDGMGTVNTVVKIESVNRRDGRVELGGYAYAGVRGIQTVYVSVDGGDTWSTATLSEPLPDADTWRQWRFEFEPTEEIHNVRARAIDGTGAEQTRVQSGAFPDGATGWARRTLEFD